MEESIGQILKKARLAKKLTIKDASDATNITSRHLTALEEDNLDVFPGTTYVIGFLRSYSSFLGIDPDHMVQHYKGSQLEEVEPPIKQLTQPAVTSIDYIKKYLTIPALALFFVLAGGLGYISYTSPASNTEKNAGDEHVDMQQILKNSKKIPDVESEHIELKSGLATAVLPRNKGINFSVSNTEIYLVLDQLDFSMKAGTPSRATLHLYPGKHEIILVENASHKVEFSGITPFELKLTGATPNTIKLYIEATTEKFNKQENQDTQNIIANPSNYIIVFEGVATRDTYVEFFVDGNPRKKGLLPGGSQIYYEANESIQMKIGDAGSMKIKINGKEYPLGQRGATINKIIRKVKDPVEQTRYSITIKDS